MSHIIHPAEPRLDAQHLMTLGPLGRLANEIHGNAVAKGFWDNERNMGEMIALAHSELSEALEEHRAGRPALWCKPRRWWHHITDMIYGPPPTTKPEGTAVELADALIRILDTMASLNVNIDAVVDLKMRYNSTRPTMHGKAY